MNNEYQDKKVVKALKKLNPSIFDENVKENNIENLYIIFNNKRMDFEERILVNNAIKIIIPKEFNEMPKNLVNLKYLSNNSPEFIYSNSDTTFGITFSLEQNIKVDSLETLRDSVEKYILKIHSNYRLLDSGNTTKNIPYLLLIREGIDDKIFNIMFFLDTQKGIIIGTINRPQDDYDFWKIIFIQMVDSIYII